MFVFFLFFLAMAFSFVVIFGMWTQAENELYTLLWTLTFVDILLRNYVNVAVIITINTFSLLTLLNAINILNKLSVKLQVNQF